MKRHAITDKMWALIAPMIAKQGGSNDNRLFIDAVMYVAKTGIPWRDLPKSYGNWNSIFTRFNRWSRKGLWGLIFAATADEDPLAIAIDSTTVRANQVAAGLKKTLAGRQGLAEAVAD